MHLHASVRGNAVFLILIGIALMAALIFVVSKNWGSTNSGAAREQARLNADSLVEYGNGLRVPIDRMLLLGGVTDTNIWFAATGADAAYGAVGAHAAAEVFNAAGGTATYQTPPPAACLSACAYEFTGQYTVTGLGTSAPELAMLVVDVAPLVCQKANDILGTRWATIPTGGVLTTLARFDGGAYGAATAITLTGASNEFVGKAAFCYRESGAPSRYIYLHVIRVR